MMQLVLIILTKRKQMIRYYESFGYSGIGSQQTFLSFKRKLVYLQKMDKSSPSWAFH
jgi:hypothetical protein